MIDLDAEFPRDLAWMLFQPKRFKVAYGGRGGTKSWGFARALLILGMKRKLRILCAREVQNSIAESVHTLLKTQIVMMGLGQHYTWTKTSILGVNGTGIFYSGLKIGADKLKSFEDVDICWVEEGNKVSKSSWTTLIPTIRKAGSEIWVSFNPELKSDDTYQRFVIYPPGKIIKHEGNITVTTTAIILFLNWRDNPWFTEEMDNDRRDMEERDPDNYLCVYEGNCRAAVEGAIFANELRDATKNKRITRVPYDATVPVHTFWDLGWQDFVAIWFVQKIGFEYHVINYLEDHQKTVAYFFQEMQKMKYVFGDHWLPHDGKNRQLAANGASVQSLVKKASNKATVHILPRLSIPSQINYARTVFPKCYFDEKETDPGLERLRRYKFEVDDDSGERSDQPLHDENSHGASAFMGFATSVRHIDKPKKQPSEELKQALRALPPEINALINETPGQHWMDR